VEARPVVEGLPAALDVPRCLVMGVLNVTPDSFSDGGRFTDLDAALEHAHELSNAGADLVDVGGESTRPGAHRVDAAGELDRVLPVVRELSSAGVLVSIDTMRAEVAEAALGAGAVLVNDVSGGLADPGMLPMLAATGAPCVLMHWRGHSAEMMTRTDYEGGVVAGVRRELQQRLAAAVATGVEPQRIVLDPGIGFAKLPQDNWPLLAGLPVLAELGRPLLVGASRKRFLGELLANDAGVAPPPPERDTVTAMVTALVAASGAWAVRVHEVPENLRAVAVAAAWASAEHELGGGGS
jgi:dihydropteroate synthase